MLLELKKKKRAVKKTANECRNGYEDKFWEEKNENCVIAIKTTSM